MLLLLHMYYWLPAGCYKKDASRTGKHHGWALLLCCSCSCSFSYFWLLLLKRCCSPTKRLTAGYWLCAVLPYRIEGSVSSSKQGSNVLFPGALPLASAGVGGYFGETLLQKDSKIRVPKNKELFFFLELYFGEALFEKGFENYSSEKKKCFFFELSFGETLFRFHFSS